VLQAEQLGTGHAVMQAMPMIPDDHLVLVLYGDVPLIRADTLRALLRAAHRPRSALAVRASRRARRATGASIRDARGAVGAIVEQKDATPAQLAIHEVNAGIMAIPAQRLARLAVGLRSDNAQHEFYLTDVVAAAVRAGTPSCGARRQRIGDPRRQRRCSSRKSSRPIATSARAN
jgi:bifunctional UDP-N-acetylglucosamine pyrophosphorylase / glucosamine-1-phosphate N-acetyltransferase